MSRAVYEQLYQKWVTEGLGHAVLVKIGVRNLADREDILQEAFRQIYETYVQGGVSVRSNPDGIVVVAIRHQAIRLDESRRRMPLLTDQIEVIDKKVTPYVDLLDYYLFIELWVPKDERKRAWIRAWMEIKVVGGGTYGDVAGKFGVSAKEVRIAVSSFVRCVREHFGEDFVSDQ